MQESESIHDEEMVLDDLHDLHDVAGGT